MAALNGGTIMDCASRRACCICPCPQGPHTQPPWRSLVLVSNSIERKNTRGWQTALLAARQTFQNVAVTGRQERMLLGARDAVLSSPATRRVRALTDLGRVLDSVRPMFASLLLTCPSFACMCRPSPAYLRVSGPPLKQPGPARWLPTLMLNMAG